MSLSEEELRNILAAAFDEALQNFKIVDCFNEELDNADSNIGDFFPARDRVAVTPEGKRLYAVIRAFHQYQMNATIIVLAKLKKAGFFDESRG